MKKIIILLLIAVSSLVYADHGWERVNYMQSTIFSAEVTVNNKPALADDVVGAFVNNECRMIAKVFMVGDKAYVSSVIHGDSPEQVEFRLWLHQKILL
jgi:hypothetical protein